MKITDVHRFVNLALGFVICAALSLPAYAEQPLGKPMQVLESPYMLGSWTHMDQIYPSRMIARGGAVRPLMPATRPLPAIGYEVEGQKYNLEQYFERNAVTGFLVLKDGKIAYERYLKGTNDATRFASWSMAKSVTSTLVGLALHNGKIASLADPAQRYVPELSGSGYGEVSLRDLLQMTSGVRFTEDYHDIMSLEGQAWVQGVAEQHIPFNDTILWFNTRIHPAGTVFSYASIEPQVNAWVVRRVTGRPLADLLSDWIWKKIGAEHDASWGLDRPGGMETGACCINATLRDYGRFGQLFLDEGKVGNEQVIPRDWVRLATRPDPERPFLHPGHTDGKGGLGYQYNWWLWPDDGAYSAIGYGGQWIYVNPKHRIVIVQTSVASDAGKHKLETQALFRAIVSSLP